MKTCVATDTCGILAMGQWEGGGEGDTGQKREGEGRCVSG